MDHTRADRGVGHLVDQDEATQVVVGFIGIEGDRAVNTDIADRNLIELQLAGGQMFQRIDVDLVFRLSDGCRAHCGPEFQAIGSPGEHRFGGHPDDGCFELVGDFGG